MRKERHQGHNEALNSNVWEPGLSAEQQALRIVEGRLLEIPPAAWRSLVCRAHCEQKLFKKKKSWLLWVCEHKTQRNTVRTLLAGIEVSALSHLLRSSAMEAEEGQDFTFFLAGITFVAYDMWCWPHQGKRYSDTSINKFHKSKIFS